MRSKGSVPPPAAVLTHATPQAAVNAQRYGLRIRLPKRRSKMDPATKTSGASIAETTAGHGAFARPHTQGITVTAQA